MPNLTTSPSPSRSSTPSCGSRKRPAPTLSGTVTPAALRTAPHPPAVVVLTSATDDEHLVRAMQAGAISYLQKTATAEQVIVTVRDAAAGTARLNPALLSRLTQAIHRPSAPDPLSPLSPRERDVLELIARGHSNRQIARELGIGEQTVKTHVSNILTKLDLQDGSRLPSSPSATSRAPTRARRDASVS